MPGSLYLYVKCACGHEASRPVERHPKTLSRLRCTACGQVGRPETVVIGWGHGETKALTEPPVWGKPEPT